VLRCGTAQTDKTNKETRRLLKYICQMLSRGRSENQQRMNLKDKEKTSALFMKIEKQEKEKIFSKSEMTCEQPLYASIGY
jgi:hypothetical protein